MENAPPYYTVLKETGSVHDISDPLGSTMAAVPAVVCVHAVHVAPGEVACGYVPQDGDIPAPDRDWFTVQPGEVRCEACEKATHGNQ